MTLDRQLRPLPMHWLRPVPTPDPVGGPSEDRARPRRIARLALIWPYDQAGGIVGGILPVGDDEVRDVEVAGYRVVAAVRDHPPYTHVVAAGRQDYLAAFSPRPDAPTRPEAAGHGAGMNVPYGAPGPLPGPPGRTVATAGGADDRTVASAAQSAAADRRGEEEWESEGGALARGRGEAPVRRGAS
jgi:hypothetical protein